MHFFIKNVKNLTVNFDDYDQVPAFQVCRQLYTLNCQREVSFEEKFELNRRFAKGFMFAKKDEKYK